MDYLLAAVDLGSNSFRLTIARVVQHNGHAQIYAVDRLKDAVQLAAGLTPQKTLDEASVERAIAVLKRYGERLQGFKPSRVRAVATNTFRVARDTGPILARAEAALGFPIEVISGQEEARLIYAGVSSELPPSSNQRLVIDIGGGSTEVILGQSYQPGHLASLNMGCVSYTKQFFPDGHITAQRMGKARLAARRELESISETYRHAGWEQAYGSSGTAKGLLAILTQGGMSAKGITLDGMEALQQRLIEDGCVVMDHLPGIKPARATVLSGGLAIMMAAFEELKIDVMLPGEGALRAGVLYDLLGRRSEHDKREETVQLMPRRYKIDAEQAERVHRIAMQLFQSLALEDEDAGEMARALSWAARLHEVGMSITSTNYHQHSAYILGHADMPGFSNDDQNLLAWLVDGHQGKVARMGSQRPEPTHAQRAALLCLRLAVLLCRRREQPEALPLQLRRDNGMLSIVADADWLDTHALSDYSLRAEVKEWRKAEFKLELVETPSAKAPARKRRFF